MCVIVVLVGTLAQTARSVEVPASEIENRRCLNCHGQQRMAELTPQERLSMVAPGPGPAPKEPNRRPGLYIAPETLAGSVHAQVACVGCHTQARELPHPAQMGPVTCDQKCHVTENAAFRRSIHAAAIARGNTQAPTCSTCHGGHDILPPSNPRSTVYPLNIVKVCANCHMRYHNPMPDGVNSRQMVQSYLESVHGKAVLKAGLIVAATCVNCHGSHDIEPSSQPTSKVNRANIPQTCGHCHQGVEEVFAKSVHGEMLAAGNPQAPVCTSCHTAHNISRTGTPGFMLDIVNECGSCHNTSPKGRPGDASFYKAYRMSYHGQVNALGSTRAAKCSDCHGAHNIQRVDDPASPLYPTHRLKVCQKCHPGATAKFAEFEPHADFHDAKRFPLLHYVWLYFMLVIGGTFTFFGVHTILWFIRSVRNRIKNGPAPHAAAPRTIHRFRKTDRVNHALMIVAFFGLTLTGMPLLFSDHRWAKVLAHLLGGAYAAGVIHRICAIVLIANFVVHFSGVARRIRAVGVKRVLFGSNSLLPRFKDVTDCLGMFRWFFAGGKFPPFDHWTYWEKFDYWAEIFGTTVIGLTGLMLWFPTFFAWFLPGWMFNIATLIHGYEALLAVSFIFTVHFFNAHLRPEKFPVDDVIFTGRMAEEEFKHERPMEYQRLAQNGELAALRQTPAPRWQRTLAVVVGVVAMTIGLAMVALIIWAGLTQL